MSQESWDEEFYRLLKPVVPVEIEYRVYYDDNGWIYRCSMINHEPGNYLVVPKEQYDFPFRYQVVDGKMKRIDFATPYRVQLRSSESGYAVVRGHAGLLIENEDYPDQEYYARNN